MMFRNIIFLFLTLNLLGAAELWTLKNFSGSKAVWQDGQVVKNNSKGGFELTAVNAIPVKPGTEYILDFKAKVPRIDGAYVNFYLRGVDKKGNDKQKISFSQSPGNRGSNRGRMSRLEIKCDHFLSHRMRFKTGKTIAKLIPVYEAGDGTLTLVPGEMVIFEKKVPRNTVEKFSLAPGEKVWQSCKLMPDTEYALNVDKIIPENQYTLSFVADNGETLARIPLNGKSVNFKVPSETVETRISGCADAPGFSGVINKAFEVSFDSGVIGNEWQGRELSRGKAVDPKVYFRKKFHLDAPPAHARIRFLGHNEAELFVNGVSCGIGSQFTPGVRNIVKLLKKGDNVIALTCRNNSGTLRALFDLYVEQSDGKKYFILSDKDVKYALRKPGKRWKSVDFDDSGWENAVLGGSPKDFGDSIIASRINNRHERLYIGPMRNLSGIKAEIPADSQLGTELTVKLSGKTRNLPENGELIFTNSNKESVRIAMKGKNGVYRAYPRFLAPGKYDLALTLDRSVFDGEEQLTAGTISLEAGKNVTLPDFEIKKINGKTQIARNGEIIPSAMFCHGQNLSIEVKKINDIAGIKLHMLWIRNLKFGPDGKIDFKNADREIYHLLRQIEHDPQSHMIILLRLAPLTKFATDPKFQDDLAVSSKGLKIYVTGRPGERKFGTPYTGKAPVTSDGYPSISHASENKIDLYCQVIKEAVNHFESSPYAPKIAGYGLAGEMDGQWHLHSPYGGGCTEVGMMDYSPVMLKFFRDHLRKKYGKDSSLQQAWNEPGVTFDTAAIPGYKERVGEKFFVSRKAADYAEAFALAEAKMITSLTAEVKKNLKRKALVWIYPKDSYRDVGISQLMPHVLNSGSGFEQYRDPSLDAHGNPTDYYYRQNGLHPANRGCHASSILNNKIKVLEMDLRTYLTQDHQIVYGGYTLYDTLNHFRNVVMEGLQHGVSFRFYSFWLGWYNNLAVLKTMGKLADIEKAQLKLPIRWKKRVCQFYDDRAITHIGNFDGGGRKRLAFYYFAKSLSGIGADMLNRSGVGVDSYYLRDLLNPEFNADQYDVFVFNSCFRFDEKLLSAIDRRLRKKGKVLIFPWGSGFLNDKHEVDPAAVEKLTGIKVAPVTLDSNQAVVTVSGNSHKLLRNIKKGQQIAARQRYNIVPGLPMFKVVDPQAYAAGKFGDGSVALAIKEYGGATSVFCGTSDFSAELLRSICQACKIHVFSQNGYDFVASEGNFLSIHSGVGGMKIIPLPEKVRRAVDHFTGEVVAADADVLNIPLRDDETRVFRLEY